MAEFWQRTNGSFAGLAPQWSYIKIGTFFPGNTLKRLIVHRSLSFFSDGSSSSHNFPGLFGGGPNIEMLVITSGTTPPAPLEPIPNPDQDFVLYYGGLTFREDWTALYFDQFASETSEPLDTMSRRHVDPTPGGQTALWYVWETPFTQSTGGTCTLDLWFSAALLYTD